MKKNKHIPWQYIFIALFFLITVTYVCIRGENIYITVHDNLDSNIAWFKMLRDNNLFFVEDGAALFLGGINRNYLASELKLYNLLYLFLPVFEAFVTGWFLKIVLAMHGFCLLGKELISDYASKKPIIIFCGFIFGILPTFPTTAFATASMPLLMWLAIKLYREANIRYLLGIFIYPVFSGATSFGAFACGYMLIFFAIEWIINKKPAWRMLIAVFVLGLGYAITEYRLFYFMLFSDVSSIRSTFTTPYISLADTVKHIYEVFEQGHYHSASLHTRVVLPTCSIYFLYLNVGYIRKKKVKSIFADPYNWLMVWIGLNCIMYGVDETAWFKDFIGVVLPPLKGFSFARTLWFNPFLWYFSLMVVLISVNKPWITNILLILSVCVVFSTSSTYNFLNQNIASEMNMVQFVEVDTELTYGEFYSEELFNQIKEDIGYNGEWSVAYGMHPAVLNYNAIATLDGYLSIYPAEYKATFRELIAPALERDEVSAQYFDSWGGRAYIFSPDISYRPVLEMENKEAPLWINPDVFRQMGGTYVFSRVLVTNAAELGLESIGQYNNEISRYTIHVYRLEDNRSK